MLKLALSYISIIFTNTIVLHYWYIIRVRLRVVQYVFLWLVYASHVTLLLTWIRRQEKTIMKLIVDSATDRVIGASMCGPDAPEIMQVKFLTW